MPFNSSYSTLPYGCYLDQSTGALYLNMFGDRNVNPPRAAPGTWRVSLCSKPLFTFHAPTRSPQLAGSAGTGPFHSHQHKVQRNPHSLLQKSFSRSFIFFFEGDGRAHAYGTRLAARELPAGNYTLVIEGDRSYAANFSGAFSVQMQCADPPPTGPPNRHPGPLTRHPTPAAASVSGGTLGWDADYGVQRIDWRQRATLRAVGNQGGCGSCWAFATTHVIQDRMNIFLSNDAEGPAPDLSIQQVMDCTTAIFGTSNPASDDPCQGNDPSRAMDYVMGPGYATDRRLGLVSEAAYPYIQQYSGWCRVDWDSDLIEARRYRLDNIVTRAGGNRWWDPGLDIPDVERIKWVLRGGPIVVAYKVFVDWYGQAYPGGGQQWRDAVYDTPAEPECTEDSGCTVLYPEVARHKLMACDAGKCYAGGHAVEMVGWGIAATGLEYWILKNSWGPGWADDGFFYIRAGSNVADIESNRILYPRVGFRRASRADLIDGGGDRRRDRRNAAIDGINPNVSIHWVDSIPRALEDRVVAAVAESLAGSTGAGEQLAFEGIERLVAGSAGNGEHFDVEVSVRNGATGAVERRLIVLSADVSIDADGAVQQTPLSSPSDPPTLVPPALPTAGPTVAADTAPGSSTAGNDGADTGAAVGVTLCVLVLLATAAGLLVRHRRHAAASALFAARGGGGGGGGANSSSSAVHVNGTYETYDSQGGGNGGGGGGSSGASTVNRQAISDVVKSEGASIGTVYAAAVELASPAPKAALARFNTLVRAGGTTYAVPMDELVTGGEQVGKCAAGAAGGAAVRRTLQNGIYSGQDLAQDGYLDVSSA